MQVIKLNAIDSTNDFLKGLIQSGNVENFTVVTAENQTKGRGQMGAGWSSETGKNLIMSILVKEAVFNIETIYDLNVAVAIAVLEVLKSYNIPGLSIKWPNDIMAGNKKLGGILIENSIKGKTEILSVVGIGLNINQLNFVDLPKASSMAILMDRQFDKERLLSEISERLIENVDFLLKGKSGILWENYIHNIFKRGIPMPFENKGNRFMAVIQGVSPQGKLLLMMEDNSTRYYETKEITMLY